MKEVKFGLIGLGNIGSHHANYLSTMENVKLAAVCDLIKEKADSFAEKYNSTAYYDHKTMLEQADLDAVIIAVPHYDHTPISEDVMEKGLHLICEKPLAVHVNDTKRSVEAFKKAKEKNPDIVFGMMFQERTLPHYRKIKEVLDSGRLGKLIRVTWINTTWLRTQTYFNSGGWRATWAGEGGGILSNQCPHNLDMYQWLFGLPAKVNGFASIGKYHDIEVEDEVTAFFQHENGMIGHFIVSTGEAPGSNRLEISGEYGKLVYENDALTFYQNTESVLDFLANSPDSFAQPENWKIEIPIKKDAPSGHAVVTRHFVDRLMKGEGNLIAEGPEGVNSVMLANAIMLSAFTGRQIELPMNGDEYEAKLKELIKTSRFVKKVVTPANTDMANSFSK